MSMLALDRIYHAAYVLKGVARKTDLIAAPHLVSGMEDLYLKTENLQVTGSFKLRGVIIYLLVVQIFSLLLKKLLQSKHLIKEV